MKGDFTRFTFRKEKHYSGVLMQQGRVQLDADWNEQIEIQSNLTRTTTTDVIGPCGAPAGNAGFSLTCTGSDILIGKGHYYVDGILCENDNEGISISKQDDLPADAVIVDNVRDCTSKPLGQATPGKYIAFLDVWQRHVTALEDHGIREAALGEPDTATRAQTVWQVKLIRAGAENENITCLSAPADWCALLDGPTGKLRAQSEKSSVSKSPCILAPTAGYTGLENQLYRVEIHQCGRLGKATFKWSRDNGAVVTSWLDQDGNDLSVGSLGRDRTLGFADKQWVELTDDNRESACRPGILVQIVKAEGQTLTIDPATATAPVDFGDFDKDGNPKVRRWDSSGELKVEIPGSNKGWIELEYGVEIKFSDGNAPYRTGDYWLIPARSSSGDVEWPFDANGSLPHGIKHHYCRLAVLDFNGNQWSAGAGSDCRQLFPSTTELVNLYYVGGDGQETRPGDDLQAPLQVRVANGQLPLENAVVEFTVTEGEGKLGIDRTSISATSCRIPTESDGIATCFWQLGAKEPQAAEARLLDAAGAPRPGQVVRFNAGILQPAVIGGACVTVGKKGQYLTLWDAFDALKNEPNIWLCLLPDQIHTIDKELPATEKTSIKIVGCGIGSPVMQECPSIKLHAGQILLYDLNIKVNRVNPKPGEVSLTLQGNQITAEGCRFERFVGSEGIGPLVHVSPMSKQADMTWRGNTMASYYTETIPQKLLGWLFPKDLLRREDLIAVAKGFHEISGLHPDYDRAEYEKHLDMIVARIGAVSKDTLSQWLKSRPGNVNKEYRDAVDGFYNALQRMKPGPQPMRVLREALGRVAEKYFVFYYTVSLALAQGVYGRLEDNTINGYVALQADPANPLKRPIRWNLTNETQWDYKKRWAEKNQYFKVIDADLTMRGNDFKTVVASMCSVDTIRRIEQIVDKGSAAGFSEEGYRLLKVSGNIFHANQNSFIAQTAILDGNHFSGAVVSENIAAFCFGESGVFVGNIAPERKAVIEMFLKPGRVETAANLIIVQ